MTLHPLPGRLPAGERILWQGAPGWRALARNALHLRGLSIYLGILTAWVGVSAALHHEAPAAIGLDTLRAAGAASIPVALGLLYAWASARSTTYTITTHRVLLRMGIALPMTINLPFAEVVDAGLRMQRDGSGDIALKLVDAGRKLSWPMLWPHARPWRFGRAEPLLRGLPNAATAGMVLSRALAASADMQVPVAQTSGVVDTAPRRHGPNAVAA